MFLQPVILREERPKDPRLQREAVELRIVRCAQDDTRLESILRNRPQSPAIAGVFTKRSPVETLRATCVREPEAKEERAAMIRALGSEEIERVLRAESVGRIGCYAGGRTYVVPVAYVYEDGAIYAHSSYGQKVEMMRQNPLVCFEVDHIEDLVNWNSAIGWGTFEELAGKQAEDALELLRARLRDSLPRVTDHGSLAAEEASGGDNVIVFRINLTETTGREERLHWELLPAVPARTRPHAQSFISTPAERWLSHERAQQLADVAGVLDAEDIWAAADKVAEGRPASEIAASLMYQGVTEDMAARLTELLVGLRECMPVTS